jgi:hypothetical protein
MPKGVYERTAEQLDRLRAMASVAAAKSAEHWRGRKRSPEQVAAHSALMRGRPAHNKGKAIAESQREKLKRHGHASYGVLTPTYQSWRAMKQRCADPNKSNYRYYGGRGITVCDRWLNDFNAFLADMGPRPEGMQLYRIDNDRDYEPGNVRWGTRSENIADRNRRHART